LKRREKRPKKLLKKATSNAASAKHIEGDSTSNMFNGQLSSYKHKDNLITIVSAFKLSTESTISEPLA
jgi:hypothetical protein